MLLKLMATMGLLVLLAWAAALGGARGPAQAEARQAEAEQALLSGVAYALYQFQRGEADFDGDLVWSSTGEELPENTRALADEPGTPPALRGQALPAGWHFARDGSGGVVLCAPVSPATLRRVTASLPAAMPPRRLRMEDGRDMVVIDTASSAAERAAAC